MDGALGRRRWVGTSSSAGLPPAPASPSPPLSVADYAKVIQLRERLDGARQEMYALEATVATVLENISDEMTEIRNDLAELLPRDDDGASATTAGD